MSGVGRGNEEAVQREGEQRRGHKEVSCEGMIRKTKSPRVKERRKDALTLRVNPPRSDRTSSYTNRPQSYGNRTRCEEIRTIDGTIEEQMTQRKDNTCEVGFDR